MISRKLANLISFYCVAFTMSLSAYFVGEDGTEIYFLNAAVFFCAIFFVVSIYNKVQYAWLWGALILQPLVYLVSFGLNERLLFYNHNPVSVYYMTMPIFFVYSIVNNFIYLLFPKELDREDDDGKTENSLKSIFEQDNTFFFLYLKISGIAALFALLLLIGIPSDKEYVIGGLILFYSWYIVSAASFLFALYKRKTPILYFVLGCFFQIINHIIIFTGGILLLFFVNLTSSLILLAIILFVFLNVLNAWTYYAFPKTTA